jgi:glycosyltransferase involved in cell wall biosynthesis
MRILISGITYYPRLDGQSIFTVNLSEGLAKRGHQVTAMFPSVEGHTFSRERNGVHLEGVQSIAIAPKYPDFAVPIPSVKDVRNIINAAQPDIVHIQDHYPLSRMAMREAERQGIHIIGTNHFMPENLAQYVPVLSKIKPLYNWILWKWMLSVYNRLDLVVAQSRAAAELIRAQGLQPPVSLVSCGIDLRRFRVDASVDRLACRERYGLDPRRTIFLFVGRVEKDKRIDVLLHAAARLKRDDIQLVIAGHGGASEYYEALSRSLNLGQGVHFTGFIPNEDLHILLNSIDVFTMPSDAELLSIASLEAMACGRPMLLADAVALPELVTPGVNGYLFKPGDADDAAHYMELLADQPERWKEMGKASHERAQIHSLENTVQRYEELYKKSLGEASVVTQLGGLETDRMEASVSSQESVLIRRSKR